MQVILVPDMSDINVSRYTRYHLVSGRDTQRKICPHHHEMRRAETRVQCSLESKMRPRGSELGVKWRVTHNYFYTRDDNIYNDSKLL